ncbi:MAG: hypothetical protein L0206_19520 [Actinobacteria bacterium]|nr:hypothetical protein [Actinomycetota bacterium]
MGTLSLILIPALLLIGAVAVVFAIRRQADMRPNRPWWGNPASWVVVTIVAVLLGGYLFPRLLGFTFLFLPFVWLRALGRRRPNGREER